MSTNPIHGDLLQLLETSKDEPQTIFSEFIRKKMERKYPRVKQVQTPYGLVLENMKILVIPEWKLIVDPMMSTWESQKEVSGILQTTSFAEVHLVYPRSTFFTRRYLLRDNKAVDTKIRLIPISIESIRSQIPSHFLF